MLPAEEIDLPPVVRVREHGVGLVEPSVHQARPLLRDQTGSTNDDIVGGTRLNFNEYDRRVAKEESLGGVVGIQEARPDWRGGRFIAEQMIVVWSLAWMTLRRAARSLGGVVRLWLLNEYVATATNLFCRSHNVVVDPLDSIIVPSVALREVDPDICAVPHSST